MATETNILESVCLQKGEREDNALLSEILEENVTQPLVNKVKQLETGPNQPLESSSQVVDTVNTQLEIGIPTNESGTFFQALLIPKDTADEHINTPESCEATTTEDQEVRKMTDIEAFTEGKPNEEPVVAIASKEAFANEQQPNKGDHELVEANPAQTQGSIVHAFGKELEQVTDISYKNESLGGSLSTEIEAINNECKELEFVKTKESVKEDIEDVTLGVETEDQGLHESATDDVCVSTDIKYEEETIKDEEKSNDMKGTGEESGPEKAEPELSDSMVPSKEEALNMLDKDQGDSEGITSSQDVTREDIKETTTGQHAITVAEQDHNERPRELIKEQIEDKSIDAHEASELSEDEVKGKGEQKPEVSVKKTEEEEEIEKIRRSNEIEEKMDQNGLSHAITTDACISTQTKSRVDTIEHEKKGEEEATHDGQKEKSVSPPIKDVYEDNSSEKVEHEKEQEVNVLDKDQDQDEVGITSTQDVVFEGKKEVLDTLEKDQGDREGFTSSQDATCEDIKETRTGQHATTVAEQDQNEKPRELIKEQIEDKSIYAHEAIEQYEDEVKDKGEQKPIESVKKIEEEEETEKIRPSVEIKENMDQNGVLHAITTDACISTQTKTQADTIEYTEKHKEEATQSDDGQKEKSDNPPIKEVCEENNLEKVEQKKEQEVSMLDKDQNQVDITSTQDVAFEGGLQEKNHQSEGNTVSSGVCISTQIEPHEETIANEEKNDEDVIESDDGNTKSSRSPVVKEICEETVFDSFSMVLNENEILSKDEDQEKEQVLYMSEKSLTESQVKTTKLEEGHEEEVIERNDSQNENSDNLSIKEVCEKTESAKVEPERGELSDTSSVEINEKAVAILNKEEVQGKEQDQVEDDVTCSEDATSIEELQGKNHEDIGKEPESDMIKERNLEVDYGEMTSTIEARVETKYQGSSDDGITTNVCVSTQKELEKEISINEEKANKMDVCEETSPENAESEARLELFDNMAPSKKETLRMLGKDQGDNEGVTSSQDATCEDTKEKTPAQYASVRADFKEQDQNERPREFLKEETEDKSVDAQKASEQCEHGENDKKEENHEEIVKHDEQQKDHEVNMLEEDQGEDNITSAQDVLIEEGLQEKDHHSEIVNAKESIEEDVEEIRSAVEITKSTEQQTLINTNATDVFISTQPEPKEATTENEGKNDEEAIGNEDGKLEKSGSPIIKEINKEIVSEKVEFQDGSKPSESPEIMLNENETPSKNEDQEKEHELYLSERGHNDENDVTSSENASNKDIKETMIGEHVTTMAYFEEGQGLSATPKEIIKEEVEDESINFQEATEQYDDGKNGNVKQKEESVNEIAHSSSIIEQAEYIEEIKPSIETKEEKDVCTSTKIESQEQVMKKEEKAIEIDVAQMEKTANPLVKKVCEEIDLNMSESAEDISISHSSNMEINEKAITSLKDEDREKDQEVSMSAEDQGKDNDTNSQHVACEEKDLYEKKGEFVITSESIDKDTKEMVSSEETKEKMEQQGLLHAITTDVCSSTKTEPIKETTRSKEKNDEEAIENDDQGQTKKPESPFFKEVCEVTSSEEADSEVQGGGDEAISSHNTSNEEIKETSSQHVTTLANFEEGLGVSSMNKEILKEEVENKSIDAQEEVKQCENEATDKREQNTVKSVNERINSLTVGGINKNEVDVGNNETEVKLDAENQDDGIEDMSEMKNEVVSKEKMSLELGKPKDQNVKDVQACQVNTISENSEDEIKKEDGDLSHESVENTNDNPAKEEKCTLEHEPIEEQHGGVDEVSKEKIINLNETTVEPKEDITSSSSPGIPTEDTSCSEKEKSESEILPIEDLETVFEVQIPEVVTKPEDSKPEEECLISETATHVDEEKGDLTKEISSDEKTEQTTGNKQETVNEECEGTSSKKTECEEVLKLSDSSNMQINELSITSFKDDDQEKDSEVNMSTQSEDKDSVSSSQNKIFEEEYLQEKNYHNEDYDHEFGKSKENVDEDTEEIKASLETNENTEQKELLHVVTTNDCSLTYTKHKEETIEKEEKNDEDALENDEVEGKSIDTQETLEQHEKEAKDKREQEPEEPANSCSEMVESNIQKDEIGAANNTEIEAKLNAENKADRGEDGNEMKEEAVSTEKVSTEVGQPKALSVEEIQSCLTEIKSEKTEDDITEEDKNISHDNIEVTDDKSIKEEKFLLDGRTKESEISTLEYETVEEQTGDPDEISKESFINLNETTTKAEKDIKLSSSLGTFTKDVEFVSEVQSPVVVPMSEDSKPKVESLISATTYVDEEKETATKELPSDENLGSYGSTENLSSTTAKNVTQLEKIGEINPVNEKRDMEEDVTQENQVNSEVNCGEMVKDTILTEEVPLEIEKENGINYHKEHVAEEDNYSTELQNISAPNQNEMTLEMSYLDPIPARDPDATEVKVADKEDSSCESKVKNDAINEEPKEERILSPEDVATIKPQVDLSNIESTAHLSESEKLAAQILESVCDVQTPEVVADSGDSKVKEECVVLATDEYMDEKKVEEEQKIRTSEIVSASDSGQEHVKQAPIKSDEVKSDELNIEEKALTKEDLELHGELKLTPELMLEDDRAIETEPQPEQRDITSENITSDQTLESKLEHTSKKHLEDEKGEIEEDVTLTPESRIKSTKNQNETSKNVILTDDVAIETLNVSAKSEVLGQISEEDNYPKELDNPSAPDHKDLENKIEYVKQIPVRNTEATEVEEESQIEPEYTQATEDLSCLSNTFSAENEKEAPTLEFEKKEKDEELISEVQTPESILKMEMKQEHPESMNDTCETLISGESSEKKQVSMVPPEASTNLTDNLPDASPKLLLAEHGQEITTTTEKIEDNINDEDETAVNMYSSTSTKEVACLSKEKIGEIQVTTLNSEIDEGKKNGSSDMMNIEKEAVQPQEHISNIEFVDPQSDLEIREQAVMHSGSQEPSEDNTLLSQNDKKTEDPVILQSVEKDIIHGVDRRFDEVSVSDVQKHEKDFDHEGTNMEDGVPIEDVKKPDVELKFDMDGTADEAEKGVLKEDMHFELPYDGSKTTEEVSVMKQEKLELDSPMTTVATKDLEISQKVATDDLIIVSHVQPEIQKYGVSDCTMDEQSKNKPHESTKGKLVGGKILIDAPHEQEEPDTKSLIAEADDLKSTKASGTEPQCNNEIFKEGKKIDAKKEKFETTKPANDLFADVLHEPTKENTEVAEILTGERESAVTKDQQVDKEDIGDTEVKTDEENEEDEEDNEDNQKMGSYSDAPVMVEVSKDMEPKVHKKSHNILSGVGSKVKHSIAKVKKAITGKSSNSKPPSPKEKDQEFA